MSTRLNCVDQTLQQGLTQKMPHQNITALVKLLGKLNLVQMDVKWQDVVMYELPRVLFNRLRVTLPLTMTVLAQAVQMGAVRVVYEYHPTQEPPERLRFFLQTAQRSGLRCSVVVEVVSGMSVKDLEIVWGELKGIELDSVIIKDTYSKLEPQQTFRLLQELKASSPYPLEFHAHDALGLATANTLSAIEVGVDRVAVAVCGVGKRSHAAFEQVIMGAKYFLGLADCMPKVNLAACCQTVMSCLEKKITVSQPIVGDNIFTHESGLHVFGIMKDAKIYEAFSPEEVGLQRHLIMGRHSGRSFLMVLLDKLGLVLSDDEVKQLLEKIHRLVLLQKQPISYQQFYELCQRKVV